MLLEPLPGERDRGMADARSGAFVGSERSCSERSDAVRVWHHLFAWCIQHPEREQLGRESERLPGGQPSAAIRARTIRAGAAQAGLCCPSAPQTGNVQSGLAGQSVTAAESLSASDTCMAGTRSRHDTQCAPPSGTMKQAAPTPSCYFPVTIL